MRDLLKPASNVEIVNLNKLKPNNYNPNEVNKQNLDLLEQSIRTNGWTLPIVVQDDYTIIDGYHRWRVAKERLKDELNEQVPVVKVHHKDKAKNQYSTITHNRARGTHQLKPMENIVTNLLEKENKTIKEVSKELGMKNEEIYRLSKLNKEQFLERMTKDKDKYSKARILLRY